MFEKFTEEARLAVVAAQHEARGVRARRVETTHLFLGIVDSAGPNLAAILEEEGYTADGVRKGISDGAVLGDNDARALESIGIDLDAVRASLDATFGEGSLDRPEGDSGRWFRRTVGHIGFSAAAKKALELSLREAIARKDREIRCEHLLLGLIRGSDDRFTGVVHDPAQLKERLA